SGYALVQGGRITMTNSTFMTIARSLPFASPWKRVDGEETAEEGRVDSYADLHSLALGEASRPVELERGTLRAQFARGSQLIDVSVDRSEFRGSRSALVVVRDDTDLVTARASASAMEEKFFQQESVRTLGALAMGIVHDLNNVLGALAMRFEVLQQDATYLSSQSKNL